MRQIFILFVIFLFSAIAFGQNNGFIRGVDVSFIPQIEANGGVYKSNGIQTDPLEIFKQSGAGYIRLRLWHSPSNGYCGLQSTIDLAKRVKQKGLKFLLDIHYSDTWADPAHQTKPAAWSSLSYTVLLDSIYSYTFRVMQLFRNNNALPDMVQIGNEITGGFLWPEGRVGGTYNTTTQWQQFTALLRNARTAIIQAVPDTTVPIMIHIDKGGDNTASRWFYDNMNTYHVDYDIIGLSYYPWWHGTLTQMTQNVTDLANRYGKNIIIAETAYPWTLTGKDNVTNIVGTSSQLHSGYSATVDGQYSFLNDVITIVKNIPNNRGYGIFYWAPEYIAVQPVGSPWENLAMFDYSNNALSSMSAFNEPDTTGSISVKFRLNTAVHGDTLRAQDFVQIRGEVINGPDVLASGEQLKWDANSGVILRNVSGDYWEKTVRVQPGLELQYKYWTGHSRTVPTFVRLGWEGPVTPYNVPGGNYRKFVAGAKDTVLDLEYFNPGGTTVNQYWRPFEHKQDSVAVFFRVNMRGVTSTGRFNPDINGPVGVRGGPVNTINVLSWDSTKCLLNREPYSIMNGSFWSGVIYYPVNLSGNEQLYKFFIMHDTGNGWENSISNRSLQVPQNDSTVEWVSFDNQVIVSTAKEAKLTPGTFRMEQNYPNPFNPSTTIRYSLGMTAGVSIKVYNVMGEEIALLAFGEQRAGDYTVQWNGKDSHGNSMPSGMYVIKAKVNGNVTTIKAVLMK